MNTVPEGLGREALRLQEGLREGSHPGTTQRAMNRLDTEGPADRAKGMGPAHTQNLRLVAGPPWKQLEREPLEAETDVRLTVDEAPWAAG